MNGSYNNLLLRDDSRVNDNVAIEIEKIQQPPDVSQNVYSNIPPTSPSVPNILKNAAADHVYSNIDEAISSGTGYMTDNLDLDLDDPLLTSQFINSKKRDKPNNHQIVPLDTSNSNKIILPSISSSSSTTGTQITSIELKNVLNVLQKTQVTPNVEMKPSTVPALRQDTMIDTALDLDSLDDGSIGNNSSIGLMSNKTAIV